MMFEHLSPWFVALLATLALAALVAIACRVCRTSTRSRERVLILGTGPLAAELIGEFKSNAGSGYRVAGVVAEGEYDKTAVLDVPVVGSVGELQKILNEIRPARIVVALAERRRRLPVHQLVEARVSRQIVVEDGEEVYEALTGKLAIESLRPSNVIFSRNFRPSAMALRISRSTSLIAAVAGLVFLFPLLALIAVAIKLDSRGPVLFVQERIGLAGRRFRLLKFRTMRPDEGRTSEWVRDNDDRITRVGQWLRKFRLDELPQFLNILSGDMNLVGPRPHPASNSRLFALVSRNTPNCGEQIPYYTLRSMVRPGITGWAQVRYQYANDLDEEIEKMRYDLYYIKHFSLALDLRILIDTVRIVAYGREWSAADDNEAKATAQASSDQDGPVGLPENTHRVLYTPRRARGNGRDNGPWAVKEARQP